MSVKARITALTLLSLLNILMGLYLSHHFYELLSGSASLHSACNVNAMMNCDVVAGSRYAEFAFGLPLSGFVTGWYLAIFFLSLLARSETWGGATFLIAAMTAIASGFSVFYTGVMIFSLHTFCLFCLGISALDFLAFGLALSLKPNRETAHKLGLSIALAAVCAIVVPLTVHAAFYQPPHADPKAIADEVKKVLATPALEVNTKGPSQGPDNAAITIVEYSDLQCPFCKRAALVMHSVLSRYAGKVRLVFKNYPLDPSCNAGMKQQMHPFACEAARAARCALDQGKFWEAYEKIFGEQESLAPGKAEEWASGLVSDGAKLHDCVGGFSTNLAILGDIDEGDRLGIQQSAPTFFVNGHRVDGALPMAFWDELIPAMLKETQ
jgi:protein-disulfide isomerase/uncharacterized membrane protein